MKWQELEELQELSARDVAKLFKRSPDWVSRHATELGGYRESPNGYWHFPVHLLRAFQVRRAQRYAEEEARS